MDSISKAGTAAARKGGSRLASGLLDGSPGADAIRRVRLLDAALSAISDFAYSFDREGRFLYVNKALLDLWGLPLEQAVGKNFYDLKYPDELAARLQRQIEEVFLRRTVVRDETEYVSPTGVVGYYEYIFSPILAANGSIEAVAGTTRDITNRVKLERDLRDSELRMEAAVIELRANQSILELQRSVLEMIINDAPLVEILEQLTVDVENVLGRGTKSAILLAEPSGRILRPVAGRRLSAAWLRTIDQVAVGAGVGSGGDAAHRRERVIVADTARDPRWAAFREQALKDNLRACWSTPILSSAGDVLGTFAVYHPEPAVPSARDMAHVDILTRTASIAITRDRSRQALKRSQQTLAEHAAALETHVADRTAKLQETISELETFSYSISHDLRAPLRAMQSFAQILEEECGDKVGDVGLEYAHRIVTAAERMDRLIQDVLTYSRVSRTDLVLGMVDLEALLAGILEGYPQFQPPQALITVLPPLPAVLGNVAALTQCLSNLVSNAVKFVPPGVVPEVCISAELRGRRVIVSVRDNGIGIDPRAHEKIFGIFYRASRDYDGTGIGLSVARRSAERMGGSITLDSTPGEGSTFRLELAAAL